MLEVLIAHWDSLHDCLRQYVRRRLDHVEILDTKYSRLRINKSSGVILPTHSTGSTGVIQRDCGISDIRQDVSIFFNGRSQTQFGSCGDVRSCSGCLPQSLKCCHCYLSVGSREVCVPA